MVNGLSMYESIEKTNQSLTIIQIEEQQRKDLDASVNKRAKFILSLLYLYRTKRYKENETYRQATFADYMMGMYNLRKGTFFNEQAAIVNFPEECKKYGTGLISSIRDKCGRDKLTTVVNVIKAKEKESKKPLTHEVIEEVIERHRKSKPATTDPTNTITFWKNKCTELEQWKSNALKRIAELEAQIERQKPIVEAAMALNASFSNRPQMNEMTKQ